MTFLSFYLRWGSRRGLGGCFVARRGAYPPPHHQRHVETRPLCGASPAAVLSPLLLDFFCYCQCCRRRKRLVLAPPLYGRERFQGLVFFPTDPRSVKIFQISIYFSKTFHQVFFFLGCGEMGDLLYSKNLKTYGGGGTFFFFLVKWYNF